MNHRRNFPWFGSPHHKFSILHGSISLTTSFALESPRYGLRRSSHPRLRNHRPHRVVRDPQYAHHGVAGDGRVDHRGAPHAGDEVQGRAGAVPEPDGDDRGGVFGRKLKFKFKSLGQNQYINQYTN